MKRGPRSYDVPPHEGTTGNDAAAHHLVVVRRARARLKCMRIPPHEAGTGRRDHRAHARWWRRKLDGNGIDRSRYGDRLIDRIDVVDWWRRLDDDDDRRWFDRRRFVRRHGGGQLRWFVREGDQGRTD